MNFTEVTTTAMMPVSTQPTALIVSRRRQPWLLVRIQWRTMPACEIVKSMNTPTAYSGIRAWVEAPPATTHGGRDRAQQDDPRWRTRGGRRGTRTGAG